MIVDLDAQGWAHVATSLRKHVLWCRGANISVPDDVKDLLDLAKKRSAIGRQGPPDAQHLAVYEEAVVMNTLAHTYADAARRLGVSKRHVERLVASGALPVVRIGEAPRIRAVDLEAYTTSLSPQQRGFRDNIIEKAVAS